MDTDGHIRYFCRVAVENNAAMNIGVRVSFSINGVFGVFFGGGMYMYSGMEFLSHMIILFSWSLFDPQSALS